MDTTCKSIKRKKKNTRSFRAIFSKYRDINWQVQSIHEVENNRCIYLSDSWGERKDGTPYKNHVITDIVFNKYGEIIDLSDYFKDTAVFNS